MSNFFKVFIATMALLTAFWATAKIVNALGEIQVAVLKQTIVLEEQRNLELRKFVLTVCAGPGYWDGETQMINCK